MAAEWYYQTGGQQSGPVDSRELRRLAEAGIVRPDTLVRQGTSSRWVRAEQVRGLFQRPAPSSSLGASPPVPPPLPSPVPASGAPSRGVSGESPIRHGLGAAAVNEASDKPERVWPLTWAAIIVGSGTVHVKKAILGVVCILAALIGGITIGWAKTGEVVFGTVCLMVLVFAFGYTLHLIRKWMIWMGRSNWLIEMGYMDEPPDDQQ